MTMKKALSLVLIFSLLLVGISTTTFAIGNIGGQNEECVLEDELDLSETQVEKLTQEREDFEAKINEIQEKIRELNRSADDNQAEIEELRAEMQTAREDYMNQVEKVLTKEQLEKLEQEPKINMYEGSQQKGNGNNQSQGNQGNGKGQGKGKSNN